jgi:hypothetical protein
MTGTKIDGEKVDLWFRATICFHRSGQGFLSKCCLCVTAPRADAMLLSDQGLEKMCVRVCVGKLSQRLVRDYLQ